MEQVLWDKTYPAPLGGGGGGGGGEDLVLIVCVCVSVCLLAFKRIYKSTELYIPRLKPLKTFSRFQFKQ